MLASLSLNFEYIETIPDEDAEGTGGVGGPEVSRHHGFSFTCLERERQRSKPNVLGQL